MPDTSWIGPAISGAAAVLGGATVAVTNYLITSRQSSNQRKVEREKHERELEMQRFEAYNKILKADGEAGVVQVHTSMQTLEILSNEKYREFVRPFVYDKFHLLDQIVRKLARNLDKVISDIDFSEGIGRLPLEEEFQEAVGLYTRMINEIEMKYRQFQ